MKIINLYGEDIYKKTGLLGLLKVKTGKNIARLAFLKRCRDHNTLPNCVRLKHHKNTKSINNILKKAEFSILRNQIAETRHELHKINLQISNIEAELAETLNKQDWEDISRVTQQKADRAKQLSTENHIKKFTQLKSQSSTITSPPQLDNEKVIINLTEDSIDENTTSLLLKGLNYSVAPKTIPTEEIICAVETAIKDLPSEKCEEIRQDVAVVLRKAKPPQANLSRGERTALRQLKEDNSKIILPADKGNATVIMKQEEYKEKMTKLLNEGFYKTVRNPTKRISTAVNKLVKASNTIEDNTKRYIINSDPKPPLLYGLPKIHKQDIPMRPIVSSIGSPTYNAAKYISKQLAEHVGNSDSFVKDSRHFVNHIKDLKLDDSDLLVSFDVESLFTKVPIPETTEIIKNILDPELAELADLCLRSTYFYFDGKFYEQTEGAAMGSPLSPVAANLYMENFEKIALETSKQKPKKWLRYVDDVWSVWPHGRASLDTFLEHLNSIHENINFTMEIESNRSLPFLDVLITRNIDGSLGHGVYRKPTHTNRYLNASSHHHPAQKNGILNTLINRAIHISDTDNWSKEKRTLQITLQQNGYTRTQINKAFKNQLSQLNSGKTITHEENNTTERPKLAYLPYIQGTTDKIGRVLKRENIKTVFKPTTKLRNLFRPIKDNIPLCTPGVYEIPCSCGSVYIGETKRLISTRLKEHIRHTKYQEVDKSAVAEHSFNKKHGILFDKTKVLAKTPHYYPRIIREAIEIHKNGNNFNRDDSLKLPKAYQPILHKLKTVHSRMPQQPHSRSTLPLHSRTFLGVAR